MEDKVSKMLEDMERGGDVIMYPNDFDLLAGLKKGDNSDIEKSLSGKVGGAVSGMGASHPKFPVGTIHNGYKKVAEGKWVKVTKGRKKGSPQAEKVKRGAKQQVVKQGAKQAKPEPSGSSKNLSDHEKDYFIHHKQDILPHVDRQDGHSVRNSVKEAIAAHKKGELKNPDTGRPNRYKSSTERTGLAEKKLVKEVKKWKDKQEAFYKHEKAQEPNSPERKGLANLIRKKGEGVIKQLKKEGKEIKETGHLFAKLFTGKAGEITTAEKHALKSTAIHAGLVIASSLVGGAVGGAASAGVGKLVGELGLHWLEHVAATATGHAMFFAKGMDHYLQARHMSGEDAMNQFIEGLADHIESGKIPSEVWDKASKGG